MVSMICISGAGKIHIILGMVFGHTVQLTTGSEPGSSVAGSEVITLSSYVNVSSLSW